MTSPARARAQDRRGEQVEETRPSPLRDDGDAERLIAPPAGLGPAAGLAVAMRRSGHGHAEDPLGGAAVDADLASTLSRRQGGGSALPDSVAGPMGDALGADLRGVRVHADSEADEISRSVQAHAFTYGQDVYFTRGAYAPDSVGGQKLLAHELAHVAQGQSAGGSGGGAPTIGRADDPAEAAADAMADSALSSLRRRAMDATEAGAPTVEAGDATAADERLAPLRRRAAREGDGVVRRDLWDDIKGFINVYPRVVEMGKSGKEKVRIKKDGDEAEAKQIIKELADTYGIEISAAATIQGIKAQYSRVLAKELQKLQGGTWEMKELRGLHAAVKHFAAILGPARAGSTLSDKAQGVTTIGRLKQAIDRNSSSGKVDNSTMGEYFSGSSNVGLFNTVTDLEDSRYIREGQTKKSNDATLEANAIHEMSHGLIEPNELQNWIAAMDFWTDKYTPSGKGGAELPPTRYGQTGGAGEDLAESVAIFFINRPGLKAAAPQREAFLANMVAKWQPAKVEAVVDDSEKSGGGEQQPKVEDTSIIKDMSSETPTQPIAPEDEGGKPGEQPVETPTDKPSEQPVEALTGSTTS